MPHGGPDWGTEGPLSTVYSIQDMAELAVRLGSPVTFDRRGNVIWIDDFESGIEKWCLSGDMGKAYDWNGQYCKTGGFSCKMTTGAAANRSCMIDKHVGFPVLSPFGLEVSFSYRQNWKYLDVTLYLEDGSYLYKAGIRYDHPNTKFQYLDEAGNYQDIPGGSWSSVMAPMRFDTIKLVADFTTAKYKRLFVNSQVFDLSTISFNRTAMVFIPVMSVNITLTANAAATAIAYIDDVIITQNEL